MQAVQRLLERILVLSAMVFALAASVGGLESSQQRRLALVVGNGAYATAPLKNPGNDARSIAVALRGADFEVTLIIDADLKTFTKAVNSFVSSIDPGDVALFYYSGHGMQIEGENYLEPIDFNADDLIEARFQSYSAQRVQDRMEASGAMLAILILDACRDNPFRGLRTVTKGLAPMSGGRGSFIAFATGYGGTASDNAKDNNGLFTKFLVDTLKLPGLKIDDVFNKVRRDVYKASDGHQLPWISSSVIGDFYFRPAQVKPLPPEEQTFAAEHKASAKGDQAIAKINAGNAALQQGNYAEAREKYQEALSLLEPLNQVPVLRAVAATYYRESLQAKTKEEKARKTDQSIAALKQALDIKGDDTESLQLIVNLLVATHREADAQTFMARLPQGAKVDPDILLNIGIKYYNEENTEQALRQFDRVVSENPNLAQAYYYRARAYLNKGKVPEAKADFQKLLAIDPNNKFTKETQEYLKNDSKIAKEAGRRYTAWFYAGGTGLDKISEQCSTAMRKAIGGASGLLAFRHKVMAEDGTENSVLEERVEAIGDNQVYTRLTKFSRTARTIEVEWSIGHDGSIVGFYVRPSSRNGAH